MKKSIIKITIIALLMSVVINLPAQQLDMDKLTGMKARSIGPAGMSGRVTAIDVVLSNTSIIYAGTASGGLWKSTSAGINWTPVFDKENTQSIGDIAIQQSNPSVVWVGTGEGNPRNSMNSGGGIYKSLDGGATWKNMGLEKTRNIHRVIIDPQNPNVVYVGAIGVPWGDQKERGVYKTTDGGKTWENILYINEKTGVGDMVMDPSNPNKLIVGMYEHHRKPWQFVSGGDGSGMYITYDGGATWQKKTSKNGLPEGNFGRMGFAISMNRPEIVYAWVESSKNAIYRSADGGENWVKMNDKTDDIGGRPFYYSSIAVDPKNENRLYTYYSEVNVSEDGGKTFRKLLPYSGVHPDHHAWWINPEDPAHMIDGNDGGLYTTHDYGKNWRFAENIPVTQFYHVNVDMELPYNVYGGAQDNGVYAGPAYMWKDQGIYNTYWKELMFGDGMDVIPDPVDNRYGYSMTQNGALVRYDKETGYKHSIKPTHPDPKMRLRFNWNSGLALDPFDNNIVYYGSQFLHKSTDKGVTWEIISPDLSSNMEFDYEKEAKGGVGTEIGSENYGNIITISPSTLEKNVIWVGTDDGHVQLTRDGGKTWTDVTPTVGFAKGSWIPQLNASTYNAGEVFVVANNYRKADSKPYLFRSKDYGKTWVSMVSGAQLGEENYVLAMVQDKVEPKLIFVGTENGLFISLDEGKNYTRWTVGFPKSAPTMDLVIHPREQDLVIGTFGRSFYILDDIRPLRELVKNGTQVLSKTIHLFTPPEAYIAEYQYADGVMFPAEGMYMGENRAAGAMISYVANKAQAKKEVAVEAPSKNKGKKTEVKPEPVPAPEIKGNVKYDSVKIEIFNTNGERIVNDRMKSPETGGLHRYQWDLTETAPKAPSRGGAGDRWGGSVSIKALPGTYKVRMTYGDAKDSTQLVVKYDPRFNVSQDILEARYKMQKDLGQMMEVAATATTRLRESNDLAAEYLKEMESRKNEDLKSKIDQTKAVKDSIKAIMDSILGIPQVGLGTKPADPTLTRMIISALGYISSAKGSINATDRRVYGFAEDEINKIVERVNKFYSTTWSSYKQLMEAANLSPFKSYPPLNRN